jgi:hypothetical protein
LKLYPTPHEAAHQVAVQLTAIRPYRARDLEAVRSALEHCVSYNEPIQAARVASLLAMAQLAIAERNR